MGHWKWRQSQKQILSGAKFSSPGTEVRTAGFTIDPECPYLGGWYLQAHNWGSSFRQEVLSWQCFFRQYLLPEIIMRKLEKAITDDGLEPAKELVCLCQQPSYGKKWLYVRATVVNISSFIMVVWIYVANLENFGFAQSV